MAYVIATLEDRIDLFARLTLPIRVTNVLGFLLFGRKMFH